MTKAKANILIVEDERGVAEGIRNDLQNLGYTVVDIVSSGEKAIEGTKEHRPDLVLMDIMMKGEMDGIEAASRISSLFDIPVVYLTAPTDEKLLEQVKLTKSSGYIIKPFEERELNTAVEFALYKHKVERKLKESEEKYSALVEQTNDGITIIQDEKIKFVNEAITEISGYSSEELTGRHFLDFVAGESREMLMHRYKQRLAGKRDKCPFEFQLMHKNGGIIELELSANSFNCEGRPADMAILRDITDQKKTGEELSRANRALKALGLCNQALVHINDEKKLLEEVCQIIVAEGGYSLAWVGYAENDRKKTVRPVARTGDKREYLDTIELRWSDTKLGRGPVGTSIRTGKPSVVNDAVSESRFKPWTSSSSRFGLKSVVGFPLIIEKESIGALAIYSTEYNAFDKNEIELLEGLANDLAYGIKSLRAERKRREAEEKLRSLQKALETTNMGVTIADLEGTILYVNPADAEMHGYSAGELTGKDVRTYAPKEIHDKLTVRKLLETKNRKRESINIRKDGSLFPVHLISDIVSDVSGEPVAIVTTCDDITERKQAEEALRLSEERYALAMSGANDGLWDRDLLTGEVYYSPRWKEMLGYKDDEFLDSEGEWKKYVHPDDYERIIRDRKEHFDGKTRLYITEFRMKHSDGSYRWVLARGATIRDKKGRPVRFAGSHTDITERKRMEEALLEQVKFINNTIESLPYPFMVIDAGDCEVKLANSAASLKPVTEGMTCYKLLYNKRKPQKKKDFNCPLKEVKRTGRPVKVEHVLKGKSGKPQYIEAHGYPIFDKNKKLIQMILYTVDITDRKKAEEELKESHEKLRSLAGHIEAAREEERTAVARDIHDELGQVLTACKFDVSWAAKQLREDQALVFERLDAASGHIDGAIQTVKKIATELRPTLLDDLGLTAAIEWQAEEFQRRTGIESNLVFGPWNVLLGKEISTAVFRLFQEALTNVARHSEATKVCACLKGDDGHLVLEIVDNGKGITRKDMSATKSFGLLGMRERVFALGGEIDISGIKGEGTKVTAMIPLDNNHIKGRKDEKDPHSG